MKVHEPQEKTTPPLTVSLQLHSSWIPAAHSATEDRYYDKSSLSPANQLEDCQKNHIINAKIFKSAPRDVSACCLLWYTGASSIVMPLESTTQKLSVTHKLSFDVTKEGTQTLLALSSVLIDFKGNFKSTEMHMYRPRNY